MKKSYIKNEIVEYFFVIAIVFLSLDSLLFGTNTYPFAKIALVGLTGLIALILIFLRLISKKSAEMSRTNFIHLSILFFLLSLSQLKVMFITGGGLEFQYIYNFILIIFIYEISQIISLEVFYKKYVNIMVLMACFAVVLYFLDLIHVLDRIPSIIITNTSGYRYHFFGFGTMMEHMQYYAIRVYGIFREPGVFAIYLCIALGIHLFFCEKKVLNIIILSIAIILTFSTAGYFILIALLSFFVLLNAHSKKEFYIKCLIILIIILFLVFYLDQVYNQVFGKLYVENDSLNSRIYSIILGFIFSIKSPLLGLGWNYVSDNFDKIAISNFGISNVAFTNTYLRMASTYGWIYTIYILKNTYCFFRRSFFYNKLHHTKFIVFIIFMMWIIMFSNEGMLLNPLIYIWLFAETKENILEGK